MSISKQFAAFTHKLRLNDAPQAVAEIAHDRLLDSLATGIAAHGLPVPRTAMALAINGGPCTIIGESGIGGSGGYAGVDAAFVNATLMNGRTQDDFLHKSHPGAVVIPAALAAAQLEGGSGADLLAAIVVGYELVSRAYLGGPRMLPRFRATGVAGTVGAGAAAARMLGLDAATTANALGIAALFACGFGAGFLTGTMDVKLNVGMAARNGLTAALLARAGATASPLAFEGEAGYYHAMSNGIEDIAAATDGLGEQFTILDTVYKEYPVCIFVQTPMALTRELVREHTLTPADIQRVTVTASEPTYTNPGFTNVAPFATPLNARVSARFCIAATLLGRPIDEFGLYDNFTDPEILAMADRIDLVCDHARGDTVDIQIVSGNRTLHAAGSEGATLHPTRDKVVAKFRRITAERLGGRADAVIDTVMALDRAPNVNGLTALLAAAS